MFEFMIPPGQSPVQVVKLLRPYATLSIGEIRRRMDEGRAVIAIEPFSGNWEADRSLLGALCRGLAGGALPLIPHELDGDEPVLLEGDELRERLLQLREIEVENARNVQLEQGEIDGPDDFVDDLPDWIGHSP